jgi:hypothetical protein
MLIGPARRLAREPPLYVAASYSFSRAVAPRGRIAENARIFDFTLSNADMAELDAFDRTGGTQHALDAMAMSPRAPRFTRRSNLSGRQGSR